MTPQERQLINELFQRLASLESNPRDPDAEAMIREGLRRAPNAVYSLVQSVLVQDEALKAANNRIQDYEQQFGGPQQGEQQQPRGFLDSMRGLGLRPRRAARLRAARAAGRSAGRRTVRPVGPAARLIRRSRAISSSRVIPPAIRLARRCSRRAVAEAVHSSARRPRRRPG